MQDNEIVIGTTYRNLGMVLLGVRVDAVAADTGSAAAGVAADAAAVDVGTSAVVGTAAVCMGVGTAAVCTAVGTAPVCMAVGTAAVCILVGTAHLVPRQPGRRWAAAGVGHNLPV